MQTEHEFVISPDADSLVSVLSGDFGDFILSLALRHASKRGEDVTEVKRADVAAALSDFSDTLEKARASGQIGPAAVEPINSLATLCKQLASGSSGS